MSAQQVLVSGAHCTSPAKAWGISVPAQQNRLLGDVSYQDDVGKNSRDHKSFGHHPPRVSIWQSIHFSATVDPVATATGEPRGLVKMTGLEMPWPNTDTPCNIAEIIATLSLAGK